MSHICKACQKTVNDQEKFCQHCGHPQIDQPDQGNIQYLPPDTLVNEYQIIQGLGHSGFGITYMARHQSSGDVVVLKELFPVALVTRDTNLQVNIRVGQELAFPPVKAAFKRAVDRLAPVSTFPGIITIKTQFEANNTMYAIMEYIEGINVHEYIAQRGPVSYAATKAILLPVADALSELNRHQLIHGHLSPESIYITHDKRIRLHMLGSATFADMQQPPIRSAVLKHGYAAPEQYQSGQTIGPGTDIYALAAIAAFMLTGQTPPRSSERHLPNHSVIPRNAGGLTDDDWQVLQTAASIRLVDRYATITSFQQRMLQIDAVKQTRVSQPASTPIKASPNIVEQSIQSPAPPLPSERVVTQPITAPADVYPTSEDPTPSESPILSTKEIITPLSTLPIDAPPESSAAPAYSTWSNLSPASQPKPTPSVDQAKQTTKKSRPNMTVWVIAIVSVLVIGTLIGLTTYVVTQLINPTRTQLETTTRDDPTDKVVQNASEPKQHDVNYPLPSDQDKKALASSYQTALKYYESKEYQMAVDELILLGQYKPARQYAYLLLAHHRVNGELEDIEKLFKLHNTESLKTYTNAQLVQQLRKTTTLEDTAELLMSDLLLPEFLVGSWTRDHHYILVTFKHNDWQIESNFTGCEDTALKVENGQILAKDDDGQWQPALEITLVDRERIYVHCYATDRNFYMVVR